MNNYVKEIKKQQIETGMVYKFTKKGNAYIHTFCEGELLYKLGFSPEEIAGSTLYDFYPRDYADLKTEYYDKAWEGELVEYEGCINGIFVTGTLRPIINNGEVTEVLGTSTNVSTRKVVEQNAVLNEKLYRKVLETMSESIFLLEEGINCREVKVTVLNDNVEKNFGFKSGFMNEDILKQLETKYLSEDGSPLAFSDLPGVVTQKTGKAYYNYIIGMEYNHKIKWFTLNSKPLYLTEGGKRAALVSIQDITKQKENELKLREAYSFQFTLINNLKSGIVVSNHEKVLTHLNETIGTMLGIEKKIPDLIGQQLPDVQHIFKHNQFNKFLDEICNNKGNNVKELELVNGRILECHYLPFDIENKFNGQIFEFIDITERKRMEKVILQAKEDAERANNAKSDFLSKMSHELRTPLNGVLGFAQLLEVEEDLQEHQLDYVHEILNSGEHLLDLINEVLDLSRIESGHMRICLEPINFNCILNESIKVVQSLADLKHIKIKIYTDEFNNQMVIGDSIRLKQVLLNLLNNAIKYNKLNGEVRISCQKEEKEYICLIADTGIGIPETEYENIFAPFYRINNTKEEGAGIGLSLVKQLVTIMGGEIGVNSLPGKGSEFWFSLPIHTNSMQELKSKENIDAGFFDDLLISKFRILSIEDNKSNLNLVKKILEGESRITLLAATNGQDGLILAKSNTVDLILLDMSLPDINGHEVFEELRSNIYTRNIPVIALSANAMMLDRKDALEKGFNDYISKPLDIKKFKSALYKMLRTSTFDL